MLSIKQQLCLYPGHRLTLVTIQWQLQTKTLAKLVISPPLLPEEQISNLQFLNQVETLQGYCTLGISADHNISLSTLSGELLSDSKQLNLTPNYQERPLLEIHGADIKTAKLHIHTPPKSRCALLVYGFPVQQVNNTSDHWTTDHFPCVSNNIRFSDHGTPLEIQCKGESEFLIETTPREVWQGAGTVV